MTVSQIKYLGMLLGLSALPASSAFCRQYVKADDAKIAYMGRHVTTNQGSVKFNYPGITAMLNFTGSELMMHTNPGSGYWMVEVDGGKAEKRYVAPDDSVLTVASSLPEGKHSVRITYCIEGYEFHPEVRGFSLSDGGDLLEPNPKGNLKIEFIGNSITCGYGTEASGGDVHFNYDNENHCLGYAYLTARALDADFNMVCRSGIGIYRNYNGPKEGNDTETMPLEYPKALIYEDEYLWDFKNFSPDIVCINLGTNDTSTHNYDISLFEKGYCDFVDSIREYYPEAKIVLLTGSMMNGKELADVKKALDNVAEGRVGVYRFDMSPQDGSLGYGADFHPSARQAEKMASELTEFLRSIWACRINIGLFLRKWFSFS